ncbi:metallophosphoesterase family protein [Thermodesulfobacteriota bacterium]
MKKERVFIVGDIHGCLDMLRELIDKIEWRPKKDRLIFLGDYVDRGRDPKGVIDFLLELKEESDLVQCLLGNHEDLFLDYLKTGDLKLFLHNGGETTLLSYKVDGKIHVPDDHVSFLKSLDTIIEFEEYYIVHAGFRPDVDIHKQAMQDLLWIRDPFIFSDYNFGKRVIFGHTPFSSPLVMENKIGLDTGAVYGNQLSCLELRSMKYYSTEA